MDANVIRRAQAGDNEALSQIYQSYYKRVYYLTLKLTKNPEDAEDVAQETFIAAFNSLAKLQNPEAFESWLFQIAANRSRNQLRKNAHTVDLSEDEDGRTMLDDMPDPNEALIPESVAQNAEQKRLVMQLIDDLPQQQRECVLLFYYSELTVRQIAHSLGCSEGTIKSRLNYARQKIKEGVEHLEKRDGIRLHSLAPIGLLFLFDFRSTAAATVIPALGGAAAAAAGSTVAAASTGGAAAAGGTTATAAVVKTGAAAFKVKLAAGITAAAVLVGGGAAVCNHIANNNQAGRPAASDTQDDEREPVHEHSWQTATCIEPETCSDCGETQGEPLGHDWLDATCTEPSTCSVCGEVTGSAAGHTLTEATYDAAAVCTVCGETVGEPLTAAFAGFELVEENELREYVTIGTEGYYDKLLTHHVRFTNYYISDTYNGEAARDGYQWRVIDVEFFGDDPNVSEYGFNYGWFFFDYNTGVVPYEGDTIRFNGEDYPLFNEISVPKAEWIEGDVVTIEVVLEVAFEVPIGYDGIVMSAQNALYVDDGIDRTHICELTGYEGEGIYFRLS